MPSRLTRPKRRLARAVFFELPLILFLMGYQMPSAAGEQPGDQPSLVFGGVGTPVKGFTSTQAQFHLPACTTGTVVNFSWDGVVVQSDRLRAPECKLDVAVKPNDPAAGDLGQHQICARAGIRVAVLICRPYLLLPFCTQKDTPPPCFIGGMGGNPTPTPQQQQALLISADLESLQSGVFGLWLPKTVTEGETVKVTLRLGNSESAPYIGGSGPPAEQGPVDRLGNIVSARLSAATDPSIIDIQSEAGTIAERTISGTQFATWNWFVRPSRAGMHQLHVDVMVRLAGLPPEVPPISFTLGQDRGIDVQSSALFEIGQAVGNVLKFNWASMGALFTVIVAIGGAITGWRLRRRRRTVVHDDTPSPQPSMPHGGSGSRPTDSSSPKKKPLA